MTNPNSNQKIQLRATLRRDLRAEVRSSVAICEAVRQWLEARPELRTVALFAALPGEVDLLPLLNWMPDRCWVFPRVCGDDLSFHQVREPAREFMLTPPFGLREPIPELPQVPLSTIDVFLCPGLAFDQGGARLGRGGGFYDRALSKARLSALKVGVCHPFQRVEEVFAEPHDVPMNLVIAGPAR